MKIIKELSLCFVVFVCVTFSGVTSKTSLPLIAMSSYKLENLSQNQFISTSVLLNEIYNEKFPQKTLIYVISTPLDGMSTSHIISKNKDKFKNFMSIFQDKKRVYSSNYVDYQVEELEKEIKAKYGEKNIETHYNSISFENKLFEVQHSQFLKNNVSSIEAIHFNFSSIFEFDNQFTNDMESIYKYSPYSFSVFVVFKQDFDQLHPIIFEETVSKRRILGDKPAVVPDPLKDIPLRPYTMTAYLFSLLALFVALVGSIALCSIQTPEKLPRLPLLIGRES